MHSNSFNKTKIVATVGPSCNSKNKLIRLIEAGVDVFRLNFSHGSYDDHQKVIDYIREINKERNMHICILQDLQGPKIRIREVENGMIELDTGQMLEITAERIVGNTKQVSTNYLELARDIKEGASILIDDGKIELKVTDITDDKVITQVAHGGALKSRKGLNLPNTNISIPSLTEKDHQDLTFGLENDIEWIALSFVRTKNDVSMLKDLIKKAGKTSKVIAKIEKPEAIHNIDGIIEEADALMVARGDLGVEILMEEVPMAQKMIVSKCNKACKPVIIATQMMESMIHNPRPTRAETNDVANAVLDGADALMLSAETAVGKFPVETIKSMSKTIDSVENQNVVYDKFDNLDSKSETFYNDSVVLTACRLAKETHAKAIIGMTKSGYTAFRLASHRPKANIFIFTDNRPLLNTLNLVWGVRGLYYDKMISTDKTFEDIEGILKKMHYLKKGDIFINTASMPIHERHRTNMLKINTVE